jgi:hypothetical protein
MLLRGAERTTYRCNAAPAVHGLPNRSACSYIQGVARGELELTSLVHTIVDPMLMAQNGSTLLDLWRGNDEVHRITVRPYCVPTAWQYR